MYRRWMVAFVGAILLGSLTLSASEDERISRADEPRLPQHIEMYTGEVLLRTHDTRILVLLDTHADKSAPSDGLIDHWFTFQTESPVPLFAHLPDAVIVHSPGALSVTADGQEFVFVVAGRGVPPRRDVEAIATRVDGFGLSHNKGITQTRIADLLDRNGKLSADCEGCGPFEIDPDGGGGGGGTCDSGGPGSTSCSATINGVTCSVTCSPSKYACCNYVGRSNPTCFCTS